MSFLRTLTATALIAALPLSALAVGGDSPPTPTETTKKCKNGEIWDKKIKKCVKPDGMGANFDDDTLYIAARELAYDGQYDHAITVLYQAKNRNDPRILNYLGFANRKAGRVEVGMGYYRQAILIDPDYYLARSYMGQSLVEQGKIGAARVQLREIQNRGGRGTWAEEALYQALHGTADY